MISYKFIQSVSDGLEKLGLSVNVVFRTDMSVDGVDSVVNVLVSFGLYYGVQVEGYSKPVLHVPNPSMIWIDGGEFTPRGARGRRSVLPVLTFIVEPTFPFYRRAWREIVKQRPDLAALVKLC